MGREHELPAMAEVDPLALVLAPHFGAGREDDEIRRCQERVRLGYEQLSALERLGWAFVAKARASFDPGYYKMAEHCARFIEARAPGGAEAKLLRGHVLLQLHRFGEAEPIARELTATRGLPFDYALLGDVMLELGRVDAAVEAYQQMLDLRPDPQGYARAAHLRWVKGDVAGAIEMMQTACSSISSRGQEFAAWMHTRLATLQFQSGAWPEAERACAAALAWRPDYPRSAPARTHVDGSGESG
jgi:tetratricopeptide (TPR) repeat protein